ncbi:MAG TPA: glycosyltransferase [Methylovirgula sp.]
MIPRLIHQIWKDRVVPDAVSAYVDTWRRLHPDWQYRLWTDADLAELVDSRFPEYRDIYHGYPLPIMRADFGRYLVLKAFGGIYADLDAEALAPFEPLLNSGVPVFAEEPPSHTQLEFVWRRGFARLVSNAVIASPPDHPFWDYFLNLLRRCRAASNPLDATGPFVLTAAIDSAPLAEKPQVLPAEVFSPFDKFGEPVPRSSCEVKILAHHHWIGSWYKAVSSPTVVALPSSGGPRPIISQIRQEARAWLGSLLSTPEDRFLRSIDRHRLAAPLCGIEHLLIAVPVLNAAATLDALFASILRLRYPRAALSLAFLDGNSSDASLAKLRAFETRYGADFSRISILQVGHRRATDAPRWAPEIQRQRRAAIARARNLLIRKALKDEDRVLWIDADIIAFPADALEQLLATGARIAHPNAVRAYGGPSMDLNCWVIERHLNDAAMAAWIRDGLYQPPAGRQRLYLSDLRYRDAVALDSVGGTMLLVDAELHRAGLVFPARPYRHLIETEAFAAAAHDLGIEMIGLPNLEILHAPT